MIVLKIQPIEIKTYGGHPAVIHGINIEDSDFLVGEVEGNKVSWNANGICRNNHPDNNIDTNLLEMDTLSQFISKFHEQ